MFVKIDFVPFHVIYAGDYAVETTSMAWLLTKVTFAGMPPIILLLGCHSLYPSRQEHPCSALCATPGICQIDTAPQSIEATSPGRHETFQYTKVCLSFLEC